MNNWHVLIDCSAVLVTIAVASYAFRPGYGVNKSIKLLETVDSRAKDTLEKIVLVEREVRSLRYTLMDRLDRKNDKTNEILENIKCMKMVRNYIRNNKRGN